LNLSASPDSTGFRHTFQAVYKGNNHLRASHIARRPLLEVDNFPRKLLQHLYLAERVVGGKRRNQQWGMALDGQRRARKKQKTTSGKPRRFESELGRVSEWRIIGARVSSSLAAEADAN
jgi:hypothetical protein